ncbi:MAG: HAD-IC family P-type ATPase [Halobacteria archaeon]|nr:HAD-IC family P-type ATPase [Halobacteria archaeon]
MSEIPDFSREMEGKGCELCGLPAPDPPVTDENVDGKFCCRGCLEIYRALGDVEVEGAESEIKDVLTASDSANNRSQKCKEAFLSVEGMHCSTCEAFIEGTATRKNGVLDAEASYASGMVKLEYDPEKVSESDLPSVISGLGYDAHPVDEENGEESPVTRLLVGGFFAMMTMVWYVLFLYPSYFGLDLGLIDLSGSAGRYLLANIFVMASVVLFYTGFPILRGAYVSLRAGQPNMDLLISLAAVGAYSYSVLATFLGQTEVYYDVSIAIVMVVSVGNYYEERIKRRAASLMSELTAKQVTEARVRVDGKTRRVSVDDLEAGDIVVVKAGERVPVDGIVSEGTAAVDESLITGESLPVTKNPGDSVVGGTVVTDNALVVEVPEGSASTLDRLVIESI